MLSEGRYCIHTHTHKIKKVHQGSISHQNYTQLTQDHEYPNKTFVPQGQMCFMQPPTCSTNGRAVTELQLLLG